MSRSLYGIEVNTAKQEACELTDKVDVAQLAAIARVQAHVKSQVAQAAQHAHALVMQYTDASGIIWPPAENQIKAAKKKAQEIADDYNRVYGIDAETAKQAAQEPNS